MDVTADMWFESIRKHIQDLRSKLPVPARASLSSGAEHQCRIIGSTLIAWLENHGPQLINQRRIVSRGTELEPDPYVFVVTDTPGLIAADEIIGVNHPKIAFLLVDEYGALDDIRADFDLNWHVQYESHFREEIDTEYLDALKVHTLLPNESYWVHTENTFTGPRIGIGGDHLWKWDGAEATLLQEAFSSRIY